jgi:hypothetical protein
MADFEFDQFPMFKEKLTRLHEPPLAVPAELDDAILAQAKRSYRVRVRRWAMVQRIGLGLAAAAVLAIGFRVFISRDPLPPAAFQRPQLAQLADVNHDGRVDILDAYSVARHIARHESLDAAWDVNGDGVVDQKDVDIIANLAVHVSGEARQ